MHDSKICFKCNENLPLTEFYKHKQMADGHLNKCKSCAKKDVKENIKKNYDYYIEYEKSRANLPHRIEGRLRYSQTDEGRLSARKAKQKWAENNVIKRSAALIVNNAIRDGKLIKKYNCESCGVGNVRIHGHHDDYAFPLSVRWLCPKCHSAWHKENGSAKNG
jgi:ribosomal protein S27AE